MTVNRRNQHILRESEWFSAIRLSVFVAFLGILCLWSPAKASAQSSNRWLFVFNTSASMRDRTNGVLAVTQDLLTTAMHGTIRPGDTIGIWTYSSELHADEAPLQTWSPNTAPAIAYNTLRFVAQHPYQNTAAFSDVLANMLRVVSISDVITVVLISDGSDLVKGTPFDERIASFYKTNSSPQKKKHMPFVTVLRGEKGIFTTNTLALAPWPVDIPPTPIPAPVIATAQKPAPVVTPAAPKPVPSLVIIGKKAETMMNVPTDLPDHSGEPPAQPVAAAPKADTAPAAVKAETPTTPAPEPTPTPKVEPKPTVAPVVAATTPATAPASTPAVVEPAKPAPTVEPKVATAPESKEPVVVKTSPPPAVEATAAAPQSNLFSARNIGIVSVVFTLLVCGFLILSARNARRAARASLITRSLDRERE